MSEEGPSRPGSFSWSMLSVITTVYWLGPQSVRLLYAIRLAEFGASDLMIGLIVGGSTVASLFLAVPSGYLLDKVDSKLALTVASLILAFVTAGFVWATTATWIAVLMLLQAILSMWVWLALQTNITYVGARPDAARQLNAFSLGWGFGMAAGPAVVAWAYDAWGFEHMMLLCFALIMLGALVAPATPDVKSVRVSRPSDDDASSIKLSFWASLRSSLNDPVIIPIMVCSFVNLYVLSVRLSFYPVMLGRMGISLSVVGLLLSTVGIVSLAVRLVLPWGVRRFGNLALLIASTWIAIVGLALIPLAANPLIQSTAAVLVGIGLGSNPVISVNISAASRETAPGVAMGLRLLSNRAGQVTQPMVFGGIAGLVGLAWAFPGSALILGVTTLWISKRLRRLGPEL